MPLTFHRTFGGKPADADWDELIKQKITTAGTVYRFFAAVRPFTYMVMSGVFARHPDLKFVAAEVNFGWLPFWAQTMEQNFDIRSTFVDDDDRHASAPSEFSGATSSSPCSTTTWASSWSGDTPIWPTRRCSPPTTRTASRCGPNSESHVPS